MTARKQDKRVKKPPEKKAQVPIGVTEETNCSSSELDTVLLKINAALESSKHLEQEDICVSCPPTT